MFFIMYVLYVFLFPFYTYGANEGCLMFILKEVFLIHCCLIQTHFNTVSEMQDHFISSPPHLSFLFLSIYMFVFIYIYMWNISLALWYILIGTVAGQLYSYPAKRWKKKKRTFIFSERRAVLHGDIETGEAGKHKTKCSLLLLLACFYIYFNVY